MILKRKGGDLVRKIVDKFLWNIKHLIALKSEIYQLTTKGINNFKVEEFNISKLNLFSIPIFYYQYLVSILYQPVNNGMVFIMKSNSNLFSFYQININPIILELTKLV